MLKKIEVNNFKSLSSFKLTVREGLNIFVGPNGAGKSNILNFFEFLSFLTDESVSNAVSYVGGAGSVFRRKSRENQFGDIDFSVEGEAFILAGLRTKRKRVKYRYEATVQLGQQKDRIYFSRQCITLNVSTGKRHYTRLSDGSIKDDAILEFSADNDGVDSVFRIPVLDRRKFDGEILDYVFRSGSTSTNIFAFPTSRTFDQSIFTQNTIMSELYRFMPELQAVQNDFNRGRIFNIDPQKTRVPEELTRLPGLSPDGSGLAATLYHLKERNTGIRRSRIRAKSGPQFVNRPLAFRNIIEYVRSINPDIVGLDIETNSIENFVRILLEIESNEGILRVPLTLASDGTVKWIALVTAVVTNRSIFAIEEPENFLHPTMQTEIVRIMRESTESGPFKKFVLMTTHSETLLNAVEPDEVIVVQMKGGRTEVKRSSRGAELAEIIRDTGFGVGHLYVTGMLEE